VDLTEVLANLDGDLEMFEGLAARFNWECQRLGSEVGRALQEADAAQLERAAHSLKGALGVLQAHSAADLAFQLEKMGSVSDLSDAGPIWQLLECELAAFQQALTSFISAKRATTSTNVVNTAPPEPDSDRMSFRGQ
jgi:HPt (histidine-containing phosphotransfer) domain-containing protein